MVLHCCFTAASMLFQCVDLEFARGERKGREGRGGEGRDRPGVCPSVPSHLVYEPSSFPLFLSFLYHHTVSLLTSCCTRDDTFYHININAFIAPPGPSIEPVGALLFLFLSFLQAAMVPDAPPILQGIIAPSAYQIHNIGCAYRSISGNNFTF